MARTLKITTSVIGIIVLLLVIAIILIATLVNPNDYKSDIENYVHKHTGRTLIIQGKLSWSFVPWIGFEAHDVTISNPQNFKNRTFAKVEDMRFKVHLWSLMSNNLNIKEISLEKANIFLITNAQKQNNWSNWSPKAQTQSSTTQTKSTPRTTTTPPAQNKTLDSSSQKQLAINSIKISNSTVHIINNNTHIKWNFNKVNLTLSDFNSKHNFPVLLSYDFTQADSKNKIHTDFRANANIDLNTGEIRIPKIDIQNHVYRPNQPTIPVSLTGQLDFNPNKQFLTFKNAQIKVANMNIQGNFAIHNLFIKPALYMQFESKNTNLGPFMKTLYNYNVVTGKLSYHFLLKSTGFTTAEMTDNLNGGGEFKVTDGTIKGINLLQFLDQAFAKLRQQPAPKETDNSNETKFSSMSGSFNAVNGTITNHDLVINSPRLSATGQGVVNLRDKKINYNLNVQYQHAQAQQGTQFTLPIMIIGNLTRPSIQPNFEAILGNVISNKIKGLINQESGSQKGGSVGNVLRGLFGR